MKRLNHLIAGMATLTVAAGVAYATTDGGIFYAPQTAIERASRAENAVIAVDIKQGKYEGGLKLENNGDNVGYAKNGGKATYDISCPASGVYRVKIDFYWFSNAGDLTFTVTDKATGKVEAKTVYNVPAKHTADFILDGILTPGDKTLTVEIASKSSGYITNWKSFTLELAGDSFAIVRDLTPVTGGIAAADMDGYDWSFNIPAEFTGETIDFKFACESGSLTVKTDGENGTVITPDADGVYSIPTPAPNAETILTITLQPNAGAASGQTEYKARFFHLGDVTVAAATVDGISLPEEIIERLNKENGNVAIDNYIFTSAPSISATFVDGSKAEAKLVSDNGSEATYTFSGKSGDKTKEFNISVSGIHTYTKAATDKERGIRFDAANKQSDGTWDDGLFNINPCGDGWGGTQFKLKGNQVTTLSVPSDMVVKQLILGGLADNYAPGKIRSVTTNEGATVWLPSASTFTNPASAAYDLVINIEGHQAGVPFAIDIEGGSQPVMWFDFVYEESRLVSAIAAKDKTCTDLTGKNHTVVTVTFDREVNDAEISFNGTTVKAEGGKTSLMFALWDMEYGKEYTMTIPAGAVTDKYGNKNDEAITYTFTTGTKHEDATPISESRFIEVTNVDELRAAVAGLSSTNGSADSEQTIIYVRNGDYNLGSQELHIDRAYNVSVIGESENGVLLHGLRDGISNPVFSTRNSTNIYMENLTIRNDVDFEKVSASHSNDDRAGVGVAFYGGNLDIMKNVTLQSIQDTQVTGERGYYFNCTIHGSVDYMCGGGDHLYDRCTIIHEVAGGYITAPATSPANKYGYVFVDCVVKGEKDYNLGRPWQNEPRAFFINTVMESLPAPEGWGKMGTLPTHFFEYGSKDADGNPLDLSTRKNSPTSTNSYSPILPVEYVGHFTPENVLGRNDSWLATEMTAELPAPAVKMEGTKLTWSAVEGSSGYMVYSDGEFAAYTSATSYDTAVRRAAGNKYTVRAISANGSTGVMSDAVTTGIDSIGADGAADVHVEYYNLQGMRVANPSAGIYIRKQGDNVTKVQIK